MKKRTNKDLLLFVLVVPIFLFLAFYISSRMEERQPAYSVVNKSKMGYSVFYEALKQLNYPVEKVLKPVNEYPNNSVQIIPPGGGFNINNLKVKQWVENGGTLIYLTPESNQNIEYGLPVEIKNNIKLYIYSKGRIINTDADFMTNKKLIKDTTYAYELLKNINNSPYGKIYFNEFYLFSSSSTKSLWDITPVEIKYIIYQMIIALAAFFYFKGKGFGKKLPLYEEVERSENEYLYSASSVYRQAKCYDLMVDNYYRSFLKGFVGNREEWLEYWEKEKLSSLNQARSVYEFMKRKKTKIRPKEYIKIVTMIENLNDILDKRSDKHWKTLKKTLQENLLKK